MNKNQKKAVESLGFWLAYVIASAIIGFLFAWPLKWSWNHTMTSLFDLPRATYWQMWNLYFILSALWKITVVAGVQK